MPNIRKGTIDSASSLEEIDAVIRSGLRWPSFPAALEDRFEDDTGAVRCRYLYGTTVVGVVLMNLFLVHDWLSLPDVMPLAVFLRTFVSTGCCLLVLRILRRGPSPFVREAIEVGLSVVGAASILALMLASASPSMFRPEYQYGILLVVMFAVVLLRLRLPYAMAACGIIFSMQLASAVFLPQSAPSVEFGRASIIFGAVLFSLVGCWQLEREERMNYLRALRDRIRADMFESMSVVDPLSGLGNRRALEHAIASASSGAAAGSETSLILVDIDHFKAFNDGFGHKAGDECIRRVAGVMAACASGRGAAFRFGGEEFLVLLEGTGPAGALLVAERIRRAVEAEAIAHDHPVRGSVVTVSLGVATRKDASIAALEDAVEGADAALYDSKRRGRNRVGIEDPSRCRQSMSDAA